MTNSRETSTTLRNKLHQEVDRIADYCGSSNKTFVKFEATLIAMMMQIGQLFILLFLVSRHSNLQLTEWLSGGVYRIHAMFAERTIKTMYGQVTYVRTYLLKIARGEGFFPLDVILGNAYPVASG